MSLSYTTYLQELKADTSVPLIGFLVGTTIGGDARYKYEAMEVLIAANKAPMRMSSKPDSGDVFRRGCTEAVDHRKAMIYGPDPTLTATYLMVDVGSDVDTVHKKVVRHLIDDKGHKLEPMVLGEIEFNKRSLKIRADNDPLDNATDDDDEFWRIAEEVETYRNDWGTDLNHAAIRALFKKGLEGPMGSLCIRPGLYFVPYAKAEDLQKMLKVADSVDHMTPILIPLPDHIAQRGMIREAIEAEMSGDLMKLSQKMAERLKDVANPPTEAEIGRINKEYKDHQARVLEYSGILSGTLADSERSLKIAGQQMLSLLKKATSQSAPSPSDAASS